MIGFGARVRKTLAAQLALGAAFLFVPAVAQATLLVRSDGAGLLVRDKNNLDDDAQVRIKSAEQWEIINFNVFDVIKFDGQDNCDAPFGPTAIIATCQRFSRKVRLELRGGDDKANVRGLEAQGPGADSVVVAGSGKDRIITEGGKDDLIGESGGDRLSGGGGRDFVSGGDGSDVVDGGTGIDELRGDEDSDTITSKEPDGEESQADSVTCSTGTDFVSADLKDVIARAGCEEIDRSPVGETPHVRLPRKVLNVTRSGVARVRLRCPKRTTIGCRGRLSLRLAKRGAKRPRRTRYALRAGRSATVLVRLRASEARRVGGRGILKSVERGKLGRKTTIRRPRLR